MNRFFTGLATSIIFLGSFFGSFAQETSSLLWKISGNNLAKPSYLFGTIHMLPEDKYFFTENMKNALSSTEVLALEADMDIPLSEQMKMAMEMMMPSGKSWSDYMTAEEYLLVKAAFIDSLGIKEKKLDKYMKIKPIYVSGLILTDLLGKVKMYEQELTSIAKKEKKTLIGLETIQEQMDIVSNISMEEQMDDLKKTTASMLRDYNELLDAYTTQNLNLLGELATKEDGFDRMEAKLLTERNDKWIVAMKDQLAKNSTFFAVGAMHLVGDNGLISQLKAAGYTVEAVN